MKEALMMILGILASSGVLAADVPKNIQKELKSQLQEKGSTYVTVALNAPFDPNRENLSDAELLQQVTDMAAVVSSFISRMIESGKFDADDFHVMEGALAPIFTAELTRRNYQFLISDSMVLYYAPLIRSD